MSLSNCWRSGSRHTVLSLSCMLDGAFHDEKPCTGDRVGGIFLGGEIRGPWSKSIDERSISSKKLTGRNITKLQPTCTGPNDSILRGTQ